MDKYEFNIKVEQIKKLVAKSDFQTAMKIADTIDWRRVRNANLLSMISSVYEKNEEYQEAKDILLIAFERAPIGKRLLYKLTQLALRQGNVQEAESYYREFCDLAGDDSRQDILRYLILKAKGAPIEQLIHSLESYTSTELDEKWLYELADLYHQAGMEQECVKTCDKIMLMFGLGQYVDKAMELKLQYAPLTKYQMDLVENRDKYEAKLRQVEQNGVSAAAPAQEGYENPAARGQAAPQREGQAAFAAEERQIQADVPEAASTQPEPERQAAVYDPQAMFSASQTQAVQQAAGVRPQPAPFAPVSSDPIPGRGRMEPRPIPVPSPSPQMLRSTMSGQETDAAVKNVSEDMVSGISASLASGTAESAGAGVTAEEKLVASVKEAEVEASLAEEMSKISIGAYAEEPVKEQTRILEDVKDLKNAEALAGKTRILDDIRHIQEVMAAEEQAPTEGVGVVKHACFPHMIVEARTPEAGLAIAVEALKKAHLILNCKHPVAKITGERLNQRGILASAAKLSGKDLIVEDAGDLSDDMLDELNQLLAENPGEMITILVDNPRQIKGILKANPSLAGKFQIITAPEEAEAYLVSLADYWNQEGAGRRAAAETAQATQAAVQARTAKPQTARSSTAWSNAAETTAAQSRAAESNAEWPNAAQSQAAQPNPAWPNTAETTAAQPRAMEPQAAGSNTARSQAARLQAAQSQAAQPVYEQPLVQEAYREEAPASQNPSDYEERKQETARQRAENIPARKEEYSAADDSQADDEEIMGIDEFAQYCCQYASQIDCNITGKSMLALYERIEIMEEDGIALTKTAAENLIEEAADKAEKPSFGKRITGLFSSKYDKEGLLILKEEHFI